MTALFGTRLYYIKGCRIFGICAIFCRQCAVNRLFRHIFALYNYLHICNLQRKCTFSEKSLQMPKEVPKVSAGSAVVGAPSIAINETLMPRDKLDSKNKMMPYIQIPIPSLPIDQCQGKRSAPQRLTLQRARLLSPILRMLSSILHWAYLAKHVCKTHKLSANLP